MGGAPRRWIRVVTERVRRERNAGPRAGRRGVPGARRKDPEGRRRRVLDEAARLFSEKGYTAVTTGEIAHAAGVAEGTVFLHYGSKPALLRAVGRRYGEEFAAAMFDGAGDAPSAKAARAIVERAFAFVARNHADFGLFLLSDEALSAPLARQANRQVVTEETHKMLRRWWPSPGALDAKVVAELLFGLVESGLRACFAGGGGGHVSRYANATATALVRVLGLGDEGDVSSTE